MITMINKMIMIKLTNFPRNHNIFVLFLQISNFQKETIDTIKNEPDFQDYLLDSSEIRQKIQE